MNPTINEIKEIEIICRKIDPEGWEDLRQDTIIKAIEKFTGERSGFLSWCFVVAKNIFLEQKRREVKKVNYSNFDDLIDERVNVFKEVEYYKKNLKCIEKMWIDVYLDNECSYIKIQEKTRISRQCASKRIKSIIEKCKTL